MLLFSFNDFSTDGSLGVNCYSLRVEGGERKEEGKKEGKWEEKDEDKEGERNTSGHEGERQIKFDHKLHEIVGEPRWSASVLWPMPTRLFLATDYHDRPAPGDDTSEGLVYRAPRLLTYRTPIMPQTERYAAMDPQRYIPCSLSRKVKRQTEICLS